MIGHLVVNVSEQKIQRCRFFANLKYSSVDARRCSGLRVIKVNANFTLHPSLHPFNAFLCFHDILCMT
jgi:hypothetical protein